LKDENSLDLLLEETVMLLHIDHRSLLPEKQKLIENLRTKHDVLSGKKVLVVDDDVRNLFALTTAFERYNILSVTAESGQEAMNILEENADIDIVLMDIMMPEMDGYETTQKIRREHKNTALPIIAVTAKAMKGDREKCIEAGASDYITKPVKIDQLMDSNSITDTFVRSDIKILVVDDREDNLFSIEAILEKDNYTIVKAGSGRAALKILLQQHDFSLILMDVQMPDLNGFETATIIYERDKLKNIPIIFITAHNYDEDIIFKGYKMGGVDYIYKPINPELLRVKVGVFVELYRKNYLLSLHERKLISTNKSLQREIEDRRASEEKVRQLNDQLIENNAHLKAVNEELDQFAYVASHDLQEPLRKIQVFSDKLLSRNGHDHENEKYLQRIINSSKRMQSLINDLLSFSRHSMGNSDFKKTDLSMLAREAMVELEMEIDKSHADVQLGSLPMMRVIPNLMQQLFYNLIGNAIKFRKKGEAPVIKIISERIAKPDWETNGNSSSGRGFRITVKDNGIGFDNDYAEEIFIVFKRLHSYHEIEGTGVGLSICKKIIEKHSGSIRAQSVVGEGATFVIEIPER